MSIAMPAWAAPIDLSVSAYTQNPDPVSRGGSVNLNVTVTNNDNTAATSGTMRLRIELPSNIAFTDSVAPGGCAFDLAASPKTLTCTRSAALGAEQNWLVSFAGKGQTAAAVSTRASVAFVDTDTDATTANDVLVKTVTVQGGADLGVSASGGAGLSGCPGACAAAAGANISFLVDPVNAAGPDAASSIRVIANLPDATDFTFASATGSNWTCSRAGTVVTCDYSGAALASGQHAPAITIAGRVVRASTGSITFGASIVSTDNQTGDPVPANNGPSLVVVEITPGTDLQATKTMVSTATGQTVFSEGDAVTLTLGAKNTGTQAATGVTVTDNLPDGFTVGTLPGACTLTARVIRCSVPGTLGAGATSASFTIPLTVTSTAVSGSNVASVARSTPGAGTNTSATVSYTITPPFAHLTLAKSKTPALAAPGTTLTSRIVVTNASTSTSAASGTVTVQDTLGAGETYIPVGSGTNGWTCSANGAVPTVVACTYPISGTLARNAKLPDLVVLSTSSAGGVAMLTNQACTGAGISSHTPADNGSSCASASTQSTVYHADLAIAMTVSQASLAATDNDLVYTMTVTNNGPDAAPTVTVTDPLSILYSRGASATTGSMMLVGGTTGESCVFGGTSGCTIKNLASGASRTMTLTLHRPFRDGVALANTATVSTPDAIDPVSNNNSATVNVTIAPVADVQVSSIASPSTPVRVGVAMTYTTAIRNNGPSTASGVTLRYRLRGAADPERVQLSGTPSYTGTNGSCAYVASFGPGDYQGDAGIECSNISLTDNESRQLIFTVIPVFPFPDALDYVYVTSAKVASTTYDRNLANDELANNVTITAKQLDLTVTNTDTGYESLAFGDQVKYQVKVQNNGPSQATRLKLTVRPVPPPQNGMAQPYTMTWNSAASALSGSTCAAAGANVECWLTPALADSTLAAAASRTLTLAFDTGPTSNAPLGTLVFSTEALVESAETGADPFGGDNLPANNKVSETTTQKPRTNLFIASKSVSPGSPFGLNEPFTYTLVVGNLGPSPAAKAIVTDLLPLGLALNGSVSATLGSGTLDTSTCTNTSVGGRIQVTCTLGTLPVASGNADVPNLVTITIPVRAPRTSYNGGFNTDFTNSASIAVDTTLSFDGDATNNNATSPAHRIGKSSIAGSVYNDGNRNDVLDAGEKIATAVSFSLYGKDAWNNDVGTIGAPITVASAGGDFLFDRVPQAGPAGYTIVETQPAGYNDRFETAGSAGGSTPPAVCDGIVNCSTQAAHNSITGIVLPKTTAASGYLFQEFQTATVSGYVYSDLNDDGIRGAGEEGIAGVQLRISGTTFSGADVCVVLGAACTATTNPGGQYSFTVPPSQAGAGYTITEVALPAGYFDGKDSVNGVVLANSEGRAGSEAIVAGQSDPGTVLGERNFGELKAATLAGSVFVDVNKDALRQGGEGGGVPNVAIVLSGTDYLGNPVCPSATVPNCQVLTDGSGSYSIGQLPPSGPSGYTLTETVPAGLVHIGAQAGSLGGIIGGTMRASGTGVVGAALNATSGIVLPAGQAGSGYHFAESGQSLGGFVWADVNDNGIREVGEPGIAGVQVTLSGNTINNVDVCGAIAPNPCTAVSAADGSYAFPGIPQSSAAGYTLTETQPSAYGDGKEQLGIMANGGASGAISGPAGTRDQFSGIVLPVNGVGSGYNFGEQGASIAGKVYLDVDASGADSAGDQPLAGITITLGGSASATTVTGADGSYRFGGLAPGSYTITETQPAIYADGVTRAGSAGGNVSAPNVISAIAATAGSVNTGYLFGEKSASLSGAVYVDANGNGVRDAGEAGIAGVVLTLSGTALDGITRVERSTTSAADGSYGFAALPGADGNGYRLNEAQPATYLDGKARKGLVDGAACADPACDIGTANVIARIPVNAARSYTRFDFGEVQTVSIGGTVYVDNNANSVADTGEALAGVILALSGSDDRGQAVSLSVVSGADGGYLFSGLRPSSSAGYTVTQTQPAAYANFAGTAGTRAGTLGGTVAADVVSAIPAVSGAAGTGYDFRELAASIAGSVYYDINDNGVREASENGIAGVTVTLSDGSTAAHTAVTAADGSYSFTGLAAGTYVLTETQPTAADDGKESAGSAGGSVDNGSTGNDAAHNRIGAIVLAAGARASGYLFGEQVRPPSDGSLAGRIYVDANDNGSLDAGEALSGVTLTLSGTDRRGIAVTRTAQSGPDGSYRFLDLAESDTAGYTVTETQPAAYADYPGAGGSTVGQVAGVPAGSAAQNAVGAIRLGISAGASGYDFREAGATLSGLVYHDADDDGLHGAAEAGLAGIGVALNGPDGLAHSTVSAADGSFRFTGLPAGSYTLVETQDANYRDGRETAGSAGGTVDNTSYGTAPAQNTIAAIVLAAGGQASGYLFGERKLGDAPAGSLAGRVYLDANRNGQSEADETGIAGATLKLSGTALDGSAVALSAASGADGSFIFTQVPPSGSAGYTLVQVQPAGVNDGITSTGGGNGRASSAKPVGSGNLDAISGIAFKLDDRLTGYLFGETAVPSLKPTLVNGYVWLDRSHDRVRPLDGSGVGLSGWNIELWQGDKLVCTVTTDAQGFYQFDNLHCAGYEQRGLPTGAGFSVVFRKDGNTMPALPISTGQRGTVPADGGRITGITLAPDDTVVEQNLPFDPAGVVYDSVTRKPVAGAVVTLTGPAGFDAATQLVGGQRALRQVVGGDGQYQFLLQNGYPTGVYTLAVEAPASGYLPAPSAMLPACRDTLRVGLVPSPALVQAQEGAPPATATLQLDPDRCAGLVQGGAHSTQYYLGLYITNGGSAPLLNNHLPLDPVQGSGLLVTKTTPMVNVTRGDLVPYTVSVANRQATSYGAILVRDEMPAGFKYRSGSATRDGVPAEPQVEGRMLTWREPAGIGANQQRSYKLILMVGSGVGDGEYTNRAWADSLAGAQVSNVGTATVRLSPDATFDCPDIIGKVFDDRNVNGYQDEGEPGIPGVRLASPRGLLVTTDKDGRFHVACPDIPNADRGSNFVMKLDDRTLPSGYRVTTENPRDVRLTRGKVSKLNFGATVHRVVRVELADAAFEPGSEGLLPDWEARIATVVEQLRARPSILRIAYVADKTGKQDTGLARRRVAAVEEAVRRRWTAAPGAYPLVIEAEGTQ